MDIERQQHAEAVRRRFHRAMPAAMLAVIGLGAIHFTGPWPGGVAPMAAAGLWGVLTAPLLHGSAGHWLGNAAALLVLVPLVFTVYPRAALRALPVIWLGAGLFTWAVGQPGSVHIGASGVTHGLAFLLFALGVLRRDRAAIAAGLIAFFLYGGMVLTVLPREPGVSWESHLGGALAGLLAAWRWRGLDPVPPRRRYSWEDEDEAGAAEGTAELEPPRPGEVPVLWQRPTPPDAGVVLPFRRPGEPR